MHELRAPIAGEPTPRRRVRDLTTFRDQDPLPIPIPSEHLHIAFQVRDEASQKLETLMKRADTFARQVSTEVGNRVISWMDTARASTPGFHPALYARITRSGLYTPRFDFYDAEQAGEFLDSIDYGEEKVGKDGLLMVYNLPQPLANYWWLRRSFDHKGETTAQTNADGKVVYDSKDVAAQIAAGTFVPLPPWGRVYDNMKGIIWKQLKAAQTKREFYFERIGERGDHDPKNYYYMFEIQQAQFASEPILIFPSQHGVRTFEE